MKRRITAKKVAQNAARRPAISKDRKEKDLFSPLPLPQDLKPEDVLKKLVRLVVRAFYSEIHIILVEALLQHTKLRDTRICTIISLQSKKQVQNALGELQSDLLIRESRNEYKKEEHHRSTTVERSWFIDYKIFVESTKYRINELMKSAKIKEQGELYYKCTNCEKIFSQVEFVTLSSQMKGEFVPCDFCGKEVTEEETSAQNAEIERNLVSTLTTQLEPIITLLRYTENLAIHRDSRDTTTHVYTVDHMKDIQDLKNNELENILEIGAHNIGNDNKSKSYFTGGAQGHVVSEKQEEEEVSAEIDPTKEKLPEKLVSLPFLQRNVNHDARLAAHYSSQPFGSADAHHQHKMQQQHQHHLLHQHSSTPVQQLSQAELEEKIKDYAAEHQHAENAQSNQVEEFEFATPLFDMIQQQAAHQQAESIIVTVQGEPKPLNEITDEDEGRMTDEEYVNYRKYVDMHV